MRREIKAQFKQATIKSGTCVLQFEVLPAAEGFLDIMKMAGGVVLLTVESEQQELPLEDTPPEGQTTINNYFVNADTGEAVEAEVLDAHALPEPTEPPRERFYDEEDPLADYADEPDFDDSDDDGEVA